MASLQNITGLTNEVSLETVGTLGNSHLGAGISVQSPLSLLCWVRIQAHLRRGVYTTSLMIAQRSR
jgi:hypothetical protein